MTILIGISAFFVEAAPTLWTIVGLIATKVLVPAVANWLKENAASTTSRRLRRVAEESINLAEEISAKENMILSSEEKLDTAADYIIAAFPEMNRQQAYDLIHAFLLALGYGAVLKKELEK